MREIVYLSGVRYGLYLVSVMDRTIFGFNFIYLFCGWVYKSRLCDYKQILKHSALIYISGV